MSTQTQMILDCGGRILSGLLVMPDGQVVPWSQEIRNVATRYVSADVLFDPRVSEHPDFIWDEVLESLSRATRSSFFPRARRAGVRRPWDPLASADALQLASPLSVLSSAAALADRAAGKALPRVAAALLDALLEPLFTFVAEREPLVSLVDPVVVLPARIGRSARAVLQKLFRRRGFKQVTIVNRELATAMSLIDQPPSECVVIDTADDGLYLHRVTIAGDELVRTFRTAASATLKGFGWNHWAISIAAAMQIAPSAAFDRTLTSLLTGSPDALELRVTRGALQHALGDAWVEQQRALLDEALQQGLASIDAAGLRVLFAGEIFTLDAVRRVFGETRVLDAPILDQAIRGVAQAALWLRQSPARQMTIGSGGTLRVDTLHGEALELIGASQIPVAGEACHVTTRFRLAGDGLEDKSFLVHLLWGADRAPEGNATLCAVPLELRRDRSDELRLMVHLRRSRTGRRLSGTIEARTVQDAVAARARFTEELEVRR